MDIREIKSKLEARGYYISPNYGLILTDEDGGIVIADIRKSEEMVVVPFWNKGITEEETKLIKILSQDKISFRDGPRNR